jgi:hypothetical protein
MTTRAKRGFQLPTDNLTLSATSSSPLSSVPTSIRAALADLSWHRAMEEEYDALITNNTWVLVCPSSYWLQCHHRQMNLQA